MPVVMSCSEALNAATHPVLADFASVENAASAESANASAVPIELLQH